MGRRLGDPEFPLLVSVRSGAKFSMPGMMETVLNIGLNDASVTGLARHADDDHFAWDSYRRLIQMFGKTVLELPGDDFEHALEQMKASAGVKTDVELPVDSLRRLVDVYKSIIREGTGHEFPQDPVPAARPRHPVRLPLVEHRPRPPVPPAGADPAHAGHGRQRPGHGLRQRRPGLRHGRGLHARSRARGSGASTATTCPTRRARTSSPASATRCRCRSSRTSIPASYAQLMDIMHKLELHYRDLCDIEFTVERGKLWMLQTRVGKRTARRGLPHRRPARRRGRHLHGRGADAGQRPPARPADVPALRGGRRPCADRQGHERVARCRRRPGRLRLRHRGQVGGRPGRR